VAEPRITSGGGTSPPGGQEPRVTERPVATQRRISQYVLSVEDATGAIAKIEKLDERGQRNELTQEEYAAAYSFAGYIAPYYTMYAASLYDPLSNPVLQAYLKAIADYMRTLTQRR